MEDDKLSNDGWTDTIRRQATVYSTLKTEERTLVLARKNTEGG